MKVALAASDQAPSAVHRVEDIQEFPHAHGQHDLGRLALISKPSVERPDIRSRTEKTASPPAHNVEPSSDHRADPAQRRVR